MFGEYTCFSCHEWLIQYTYNGSDYIPYEVFHPTTIKFEGITTDKINIILEKLVFTNQSQPEDLVCQGTNELYFPWGSSILSRLDSFNFHCLLSINFFFCFYIFGRLHCQLISKQPTQFCIAILIESKRAASRSI
jgi:hypothetical protein